MQNFGELSKMKTQQGAPIQYTLKLGDDDILMNRLLNREIAIKYSGIIHCVSCGVVTKKSFGQGFCYKCFMNSPMNSECIIRPELCEAHVGKGRDPQWEEEHHNSPHVVYIALTDVAKVGVTRVDQIPTRWIDQGAHKAILLAEVPYRQLAGIIEVAMKDVMVDKTNWRKMLRNEIDESLDPHEVKEEAYESFPEELEEFFSDDDKVWEFQFPVVQYPEKIKSVSLDKMNTIEGTLLGIKGQYLIFDGDRVFNVRNHSGYQIQLEA